MPKPTPSPTQLLIRITAAALNHRDLFIRQHLYPSVAFNVPLLADGCGVVEEAGSSVVHWKGKRVVLVPGQGWASSLDGPEGAYAILGGTSSCSIGTLQEYVCTEASDVEEAPEHLSDVEAAALPLTGLTAWRAVMSKSANAVEGRNILVTGIGGGVALMALMLGTGKGINVFVSSGSDEKIKKALELGAKGGVNYRETDWEKKLKASLPKDRPYLDAVIDGAGGDIVEKATKILKVRPKRFVLTESTNRGQFGGIIVSYGMTLGPRVPFPMSAVLKNVEIRGTMMGSRKEFADLVELVRKTSLKPVVSRSIKGLEDLDAIDSLFEDMKASSQFGKLVVEIGESPSRSKL